MAIKAQFLSRIPHINYCFKNGKRGTFYDGKYLTDIVSEIEELNAEVKEGHPHIYIDPETKEIDDTKLDPLAAVKAAAIREYILEQERLASAKANNQDNDMGTSVQGTLKTANSRDVAQAAAGGSGAVVSAKLASLIPASIQK